MKGRYRLMAMDVDGTVLTDDKQLPDRVLDSIRELRASGCLAVIATGRALSEMGPLRELLESCDLAILESGALLYDILRERVMKRRVFRKETVLSILETACEEDCMLYAFSEGMGYMGREDLENLEHYHMQPYRALYENHVCLLEDAGKSLRGMADGIEKILIYHATEAGRENTARRCAGLDAEMAFAERTSLELSPGGISKGASLRELCALLGLELSECAAIGDAENDLSMLEIAGVSFAMGNAPERIRARADRVVGDNNHGGVAEAVDYLLRHGLNVYS